MFNASRKGFTIVETLIALGIGAIVIASVYQIFHDQQRSFLIQDQVIEVQQNARVGMYFMANELRSAGFDPEDSKNFGFVTDFEDPHGIFDPDINYTTDRDVVAFTMDDNGNGIIDAVKTPTANPDNEFIAYQFNTDEGSLERYSKERNQWETVATNVEALDLVYLDTNGNVTTNPDEFHAVEITIVSRTKTTDNDFTTSKVFQNKQGEDICPTCALNPHFRRRLLSSTIRMRNL